jgi:hypothetical protein
MTPLSNDNDNHLMPTSHCRRSLSEGQSGISPVQEAMIEHLAYIVLAEGRPARTRDFLNFEVNGVAYSLKPGTIRNHLSHLRRLEEIEIDYKSVCTLYTLPGYSRRKSLMTSDHALVSSRRDLAGLISRLAYGTASAHDIRLRFSAGIYDVLSVLAAPTPPADDDACVDSEHSARASPGDGDISVSKRKRSKDLVLKPMRLDRGLVGKVTVHRSGVASVILACSEMPIRFDIGGLVRLTAALARIEERLLSLIDTAVRLDAAANFAANSSSGAGLLSVPEFGTWVVTMWHVGFDSLERYAGERFEIAWEDFTGAWTRAYTKLLKEVDRRGRAKSRSLPVTRLERQEYPDIPVRTAVEEKLSAVLGSSLH